MRAAMLAAALMLAACEEQDDFVPEEGQWEVVESLTDGAECASLIDTDFTGAISLDITDDIELTPDPRQIQFDLRLDSTFMLRCNPSYPNDFYCRLEDPSGNTPFRNDTYFRDVVDGIIFFDSAESAVVSLTVALDCEGDLCPPDAGSGLDSRPALPCSYRQTFRIVFAED